MNSTELSPTWARALPPGPDTRVAITEAYAAHVARDAFFWAWPLVNLFNRRIAFSKMKEHRYVGPLLEAPLNRLTMLTDYVDPDERNVACPNQDVVYGLGMVALDVSPVVIQVPDFGDRFWVYQIVDLRTDSFVQLGKMHGSTPGFYLLVGPDWNADVPAGITRVFRASSKTGLVAPRIFQDDTPQDKQAVQPALTGIVMYPLAEYDGQMKSIDWSKLPRVAGAPHGEEETRWVLLEKFFDELSQVLADAPPLPGEEARYAQVLAVLAAADGQRDRSLIGGHEEQGSRVRCRWLADDRRAIRCARRPCAPRQLAACAEGRFFALRSRLLAQGRGDGRHLGPSGGSTSDLSP